MLHSRTLTSRSEPAIEDINHYRNINRVIYIYVYGSLFVKSLEKKVDILRFCSKFNMLKYRTFLDGVRIFSSKK